MVQFNQYGSLNGNIGMVFHPSTKRLALGTADGIIPNPTKTLDVFAGGVRLREFISQIFLSTNANGDIIDAVLNLNNVIVGNASNKPVELEIPENTALGRLSGNIEAIDITHVLEGNDTLISGQCTITDARITVNSIVQISESTVGFTTSVPTRYTLSAGQVVFTNTDAGNADGEFSYRITL